MLEANSSSGAKENVSLVEPYPRPSTGQGRQFSRSSVSTYPRSEGQNAGQ
jgi:hypothetical protein